MLWLTIPWDYLVNLVDRRFLPCQGSSLWFAGQVPAIFIITRKWPRLQAPSKVSFPTMNILYTSYTVHIDSYYIILPRLQHVTTSSPPDPRLSQLSPTPESRRLGRETDRNRQKQIQHPVVSSWMQMQLACQLLRRSQPCRRGLSIISHRGEMLCLKRIQQKIQATNHEWDNAQR